ncbi:lipocalin family protein [Aquimarina longa]|uniref:lipocalin family protein n=1 Tax=Aquimarina longa TaxID=1080221 RepID=UPI0007838F66|nr:lipocalin family protein [Aquimarina longa]
MKKISSVLVIIISIAIFSCGSDDVKTPDPIIGVWTLSERFQNGSTVELTNCKLKNAIIVMPDGTFESKFYKKQSNNTCELYLESSGTWKSLGNNTYTLIEDEKDPYTSEINEDGSILSLNDSFEFQGGINTLKEVFTKL